MGETYGDYDIEKKEISQSGDEYQTWEYTIKNIKTGKQFKYVIDITKTALSCERSALQNPEAVFTEGESLVNQWLDERREERLHASVVEKGVTMMETKWQR